MDVDVNATVAGTLGVTGATTLSSTLGVTGAITGSSTLQATTITATTAFVPDASDGASLGTVSLEFSDLFLADGALIAFGNDQDVTITHLADAGLLLNGARGLFFNDTTQYINAPNGTTLDIAATDEIELNATLIDINGAVDISGNLDVGGNLVVTGTTTFNGGTLTMGDAATDNVVFGADINSNIIPNTDDTYDLGSSSQEWRNLYIDGTANIDSLVADTADINGGTIDGATIAASDITVGSGKTLNVSAGTLTLADDQISGDKVEGGTIAATTITTLTSTTVDTTNLEVTTLKAKDGTAAGSIADSTGVVTLASSVLTTTDINGGTIDGANITVGAAKTLDVSAGTLTLADNQISGDKVEGGTIAATTITALTFGSLNDGVVTVTAFADEDDMVSNSATLVPTQQSVKAYVDAQVTAQDLDIVGDTGTDAIDLDSETITFAGGTGITSVVTTGTVTHNIDSTVATLTGSQTLTNKSLTAPTLTGTAIVASLDISGDIDVDGTTNLDVVDIDGAVDFASTTAHAGNATFADNVKAIFGTDSDLQIYHDGSHSYIRDNGTGQLKIMSDGDGVIFEQSDGANTFKVNNVGETELFYSTNQKLATSASGISVTGTVTADGLTTNGAAEGDTYFTGGTASSRLLNVFTSTHNGGANAGHNFKIASGQGAFIFGNNTTANLLTVESGGIDVTGTVTADGITTSLGIDVNGTDDLRVRFLNGGSFKGGAQAVTTAGDMITGSAVDDVAIRSQSNMLFAAGGATERMRIDASGNVIIGGSTAGDAAADNLTLVDSGNAGMTIQAGDTSYASIYFKDSASPNPGYIQYKQGDDFMRFATGGSERLRIDASGNVGIGCTPAETLDVKSGNASTYLRLQTATNSGVYVGNANGQMLMLTGATERMRIDSTGRVGIGRTPSISNSKLEVGGADNVSLINVEASGVTGGMGIGSTGLQFFHGSSAKMRIDASGNVRMGDNGSNPTDTDADNLIVANASGAAGIQITTASSSVGKLIFGDAGNARSGMVYYSHISNFMRFDTVATERMRIDSSGRVGIGTSSPSAPLTVQCTSLAKGIAINGRASDDIGELQYFENDGTTLLGEIQYRTDHVNFRHRVGDIRFATGGTTERMRLDSSGNLLVGKTASSSATAGHELLDYGRSIHTANATTVQVVNRLSNDGDISIFQKDGTTVGSIGSRSAGANLYITFRTETTGDGCGLTGSSASTGAIIPSDGNGAAIDDHIDLGATGTRFDDIYATNGTIQTSDRNEKQDIEELSDAEQRVAVAAKGLLRKFRWKSSVAEKGDEARTHFGIIAQDLQAAFAAEGLDAGDYAMFINSTWTDEETGEERSRMGVRYSELLAFIIAAI